MAANAAASKNREVKLVSSVSKGAQSFVLIVCHILQLYTFK